MQITDEMVNRADSILSRSHPGIPDETIRLALAVALSAALSVETRVKVRELEWHKSHMSPWNDDWHTTTPFIYTVRCADENGWKWSAHGASGYAHSPEAAKAAAQADYSARILSALSVEPDHAPQQLLRGKDEAEMMVDEFEKAFFSRCMAETDARRKAYEAARSGLIAALATEGKNNG